MNLTPSPLVGRVAAPPSKSAAHRALIAAMLAGGESVLLNIGESDDIAATRKAIETLGARVRKGTDGTGRSRLTVTGGLPHPGEVVIDCGESGSTLRFLVPVALAMGGTATFTGAGRLPQRPMQPYFALFDRCGVAYRIPGGGRFLPLCVTGTLQPGHFRLPGGVSSQFVSGLIMALPLLPGDSTVTVEGALESAPYVELTLSVMERFGIRVVREEPGVYRVPGGQRYRPATIAIEGDWSQAAFWLTAGALGGDVRVDGLDGRSVQGDRAIFDILRSMGADIAVEEDGAVRCRRSPLRATDVDVSQRPDLAPAVAAALALSRGEARITGCARLRLKESDRVDSIVRALAALGADIRADGDAIAVRGVPSLRGGDADSCGDHRIAMMIACVSSRCAGPVRFAGAGAVRKSYPGFWDDMARLGGNIQ